MSTDSQPDLVFNCGENPRLPEELRLLTTPDYYGRSACKGEQFFKEHQETPYCVLHYPSQDKVEPFRAALKRKLDANDFDFSHVWFPEEADFENFTFSAEAIFDHVTFSADAKFDGANFNAEALFDDTTFSGIARFNGVTFNDDASFERVKFNERSKFENAIFCKEVNFHAARFFGDTEFGGSTFNADTSFFGTQFNANTEFDSATFKSYVLFAGSVLSFDLLDYLTTSRGSNLVVGRSDIDLNKKRLGKKTQLSFGFSHFEKPECVSFHTLDLRPFWFINVDTRKFDFTDVDFKYVLKDELECLKTYLFARNRALAITFRQLADNAESNHRYQEASRFRYDAFECRRIEKFWGFVPWRLDWWYWLASGYGERVGRAAIVFVLLLSLFAFGYKNAEFDPPSKTTSQSTLADHPETASPSPIKLSWSEAARYSFSAAILQKPEPKPRGNWNWLVLAETVLGPAQAALLALAVRRRFMR